MSSYLLRDYRKRKVNYTHTHTESVQSVVVVGTEYIGVGVVKSISGETSRQTGR